MPRSRPFQRDVSRKLQLEVLERRDFLAADLMPIEFCTGEVYAVPPEVVSNVASDSQEIALDNGKKGW